MGLSASQARLLSLTGRMHDIEYRAQHLEAKKLQLANDSDHVYRNYQDALNAAKIQVRQINNDGSSTFVNATYNVMKDMGYEIRFDNCPLISRSTKNNFDICGGNKDYFVALEVGRISPTNNTVNGVKEIYTAEQLIECFTNTSGGNYRLMCDIDMADQTSWSIKTINNLHLDGNGYSIKNLHQVMFGTLMNSTIDNLKISGDIVNEADDKPSKALLANYSLSTTISNVSLSGSLKNEDARTDNNFTTGKFVGSLIGMAQSGTKIENCSSSVNVDSNNRYVGGLVGCVGDNVEITNCSSSGNVKGISNVGGLIGHTGQSYNITIQNCSSSGDVTATGNNTPGVGGLIGYVDYNTNQSEANNIKDCSATGNVYTADPNLSGSGNFIGSIAAQADNTESNIIINNCSGFGTVNYSGGSNSENDRFVGVNNTSNVEPVNSNRTASVTPPTIRTNVVIDEPNVSNAEHTFDLLTASGGNCLIEDEFMSDYKDDYMWFTNHLKEGLILLYKEDGLTGEWLATNVATDVDLQEVVDDVAIKKAEATYESDMRKINNKDKKYDTELGSLESERTAIKTEMETLKTVAKDNIDKTFKLFS